MHLLLEGFDGGIDGGQLALQSIPPEAEHGHLALLVLAPPLVVITSSVAAERGEHGMESALTILTDFHWSRGNGSAWLFRINGLRCGSVEPFASA